MELNGIKKIQKNRENTSIQSMFFNRYLLIRYIAALFLFTNIYWSILLLLSHSSLYFIPLSLAIITTISLLEQIKIYRTRTNNVKYTHYSFIVLFTANVFLLMTIFSSQVFKRLYPFLVNQTKARALISVILVIGLLLSATALYRLSKIRQNKDKNYLRAKKFEATIHSHYRKKDSYGRV